MQPTQQQLDMTYANDDRLGIERGTTARQITTESSWNPDAVSKKGAVGYVQVIPETLASISGRVGRNLDPKNFDDALTVHYEVMSENMKHFGNLPDALRAYNSGWDKARWDNDETNAYVPSILGTGNVKHPKGTNIAQQDALRAGARSGITQRLGDIAFDNDTLEATQRQNDMSLMDAAEDQGAARLADTTHTASFAESFQQSAVWDTLAGRMVDAFSREEATPGWAMSTEQKQSMAQETPGVWANDDLRQYVEGADSDKEWSRRMGWAQQRADYLQRAANSAGVSTVGAGLLAGMGDPVMLAATLGSGAIVSASRAAFTTAAAAEAATASRGVGAAWSAAGGAAGNVAADVAIRFSNNQDIKWPELFQQALVGAALGGAGHYFGAGTGAREVDAALAHAGDERLAVADRQVQSAGLSSVDSHPDAGTVTVGTNDYPVNPVSSGWGERIGMTDITDPNAARLAEAMESLEARRAARLDAEAEVQGPKDARAENPVSEWAPRMIEKEGKSVEVAEAVRQEEAAIPRRQEEKVHTATYDASKSLDLREFVEPTSSARAELARLAESAEDPMTKALAVRLGEQLKDDVPVIRVDKPGTSNYKMGLGYITLYEDGSNPRLHDNTALHEIAHAVTAHKIDHGLKNPRTVHGKLASELEALRKKAKAEYKGSDSDARYFLSDIHEFVAGLYSGRTQFIDHLAGMKAKGSSILSRTVDIVRSLLGLAPNEVNALTQAMGLSDKLIDTPFRTETTLRSGDVQTVLSAPPSRDDVRLGELAKRFVEQSKQWKDVLPKATDKLRSRATYLYDNSLYSKSVRKAIGPLLDTVGMTLGRSKNKMVRMWASDLGEDATGVNRQHATSAAIDKARWAATYRTPVVEAYHRALPELLTSQELAARTTGFGGNAAEKRVGRLVAEERLRHRAAVQRGEAYQSTAPKAVRQMAGVVDSMWKSIAERSKAVGEALGSAIHGTGWVGHQPYKWDWAAITHAYNNDTAKFNAFKALLRAEYTKKVLDPAMDKLHTVGPMQPGDVDAFRTKTLEKVGHLVDNYIHQVMQDPRSRTNGRDEHFATIAADLLKEDHRGDKVTNGLADSFRERLAEIIKDRTRTEFDLLAKDAEGNSLLDFMDTDIGRMVETNSSKFAGAQAMAQRGLQDPLHVTALKQALVHEGASQPEVDGIDFLLRSLTDDLDNNEHPVGRLLQQGAHMTMMGKLGFNALADAASVVFTSGMGGFLKTMKGGILYKDSKLAECLKTAASSALGLDHRLHFSETTSTALNPESILSEGSTLRRMANSAGNAVGHLSGMHYVGKMIHRGYLPVLTEDVLRAIHGKDGGVTPARLADMGLNPEVVDRVKAQLDQWDAGRKKGDAINWDKWDDQYAADALIGSLHRAAGQALQRTFIGESPRWLSEGPFGKMVGQFKRYGVVAAEKQAARNLLIGDSNTAVGFAFSTAWGAMLYYAKMQANMALMDDAQREKYEKENLTGVKAIAGTLVMVNAAGVLPDTLDATSVLFGGQAQRGGSPVASIGYLDNLFKAGRAGLSAGYGVVAGHAPGDENVDEDYVRDAGAALRILPGANTVFGTALANELKSGD